MANSDPHPITIAPNTKTVSVHWRGHLIAETTRALTLKEATYPGVVYIPREDTKMAHLLRTTHQTRCPYKGVASYYSLSADGATAPNAVWTYEAPIATASAIAGYLAFYPDVVEITQTPL